MINKVLARRIEKMRHEDQRIRKLVMKNPSFSRRMVAMDQRHTKIEKQIVRRFGWPTFSLVGKHAAHSFWLLVQHADLDHVFQKKCLKLIIEAAKKNQAFLTDVAYLTDRVRIAEGEKQLFGTQFTVKNNALVLKPIANRRTINTRRKKHGLDTIEAYIQRANTSFKKLS